MMPCISRKFIFIFANVFVASANEDHLALREYNINTIHLVDENQSCENFGMILSDRTTVYLYNLSVKLLSIFIEISISL